MGRVSLLLIVGLVVACLVSVKSSASVPTIARGSPIASSVAMTISTSSVAHLKSSKYLPEPTDLGNGWQLERVGVPGADAAVFVDSANAFYTGPSGARIEVFSYTNRDGRVAEQRSWEGVSNVFDNLAFKFTDRSKEANGASPNGCVDRRQIEGTDLLFGVAVGLEMCAVGKDVTILAIASGNFGRSAGGQAAEDVVAIAIHTGTR